MRRRFHAPSYGLTYPSVIRLGKLLGATSYHVDMMQLAVAHFMESARHHPGGDRPFIAQVKTRHRVPSNGGDLAVLHRTPELYLLQGVAIASQFAREFRQDYLEYSRTRSSWITHDGKENLSALAQLKANLPAGGGLKTIAKAEFALLEYYRTCRNVYLHALGSGDASHAHALLMQRHGATLRETFRRVPSEPEKIVHGDYVLLGRSLLVLAQKVSDACPLTVQDAAAAFLRDEKAVRSLKPKRGAPMTLERKVAGQANELFWATPRAAREVAKAVTEAISTSPNGSRSFTRNRR